MIPPAPRRTMADYLIIAVSPVLIMALVGSLCFFLVDVFFRGALAGNVRWVLFWFVIAVVLVARIGIEQGSGHAMFYGLALAAATWIYLMWLHPAYFLGILLLGVVWWCAHKLTRDCTLIDEDEDASGFGLLQMVWRRKRKPGAVSEEARKPTKKSSGSRRENKSSRRPKPHPPGLWVVYFSLAALPLFGVGQMLLPGGDTGLRRAGLTLLLVYMTAALGLLLTTSFLGLRRYLRQRRLAMPGIIAFGWIRFGAVVAGAVLVAALLVPRPGVSDTWTTLRYHINYQLRRASQFASRSNPHGAGPGRGGHEAEQPGAHASQGSAGQAGTRESTTPGESRSPSTAPGGTARNRGSERSPAGSTAQGRGSHLFGLFKGLFYLAAVLLFIGCVVRYRHLIAQIIRSIMTALANFFRSLAGFRINWQRSRKPGERAARPKQSAFAAYADPFAAGSAQAWPSEQVVLYSYEALKSWAAERGIQPGPQQTAREYCAQLGETCAEISSELDRLSILYGHAAYGVRLPANCDLEPLRRLWNYLSTAGVNPGAQAGLP